MKKPSCLLFDPYLRTLGGGERYLFALAASLRDEMNVTVAGPWIPPASELERSGLDQSMRLRRVAIPAFTPMSAGFDTAIYMTNRPPLPSLARRSFLIVQFPFVAVGERRIAAAVQRRILAGYRCIVYSDFVRHWTARRWDVDSVVLRPPVDIGTYDARLKRATILAVGRFFTGQSSKRQDALVEAFRRLPERIRDEWRLVLAGELCDRSGRPYVDELRSAASGLRVEIETSVSRGRLIDLYREASLFWHAAGFGRRDGEEGRAEHFGISTVEAMSFGAVPLVYDDGGQREIVQESFGYRWASLEDLAEATAAFASDPLGLMSRATLAAEQSKAYAPDVFHDEARGLILG